MDADGDLVQGEKGLMGSVWECVCVCVRRRQRGTDRDTKRRGCGWRVEGRGQRAEGGMGLERAAEAR